MKHHIPVSTVVAAFLRVVVAGTLVAACVEGADETYSQVESAATVASYTTSSCSTSVVLGLSKQIAEEVGCAAPDSLVKLSIGGNLRVNSSSVLPYLSATGKASVEAVAATRVVRINSAFRTVAQQYLLYQWFRLGRCNIPAAATPGTSNHESGRALDIQNYSELINAMAAKGWSHDVPGDPVHFNHLASPDIRGRDVLAFQKLWNRNHPDDLIDEDGDYGTDTAARIRMAPSEGFPIGSNCSGTHGMDVVSIDAPDRVGPALRVKITMRVKNTGTLTWPQTTHLRALSTATSVLYDPTWESSDVVAQLVAPVAPGATGTLEFFVTTPNVSEETPISEDMTLDDNGATFGDIQVALIVVPGVEEESGEGNEVEEDVVGGCTAGGGGVGGGTLALCLLAATGLARRRRTGTRRMFKALTIVGSFIALALVGCSGSLDATVDAGLDPDGDAELDPDAGVELDPDAAPAIPDPCPPTTACAAVPGNLVEGGGLRAINRCAFPLAFDEAQRTSFDARIDAYPASLKRVTLADIAGDLNRTATKVTSVPGNPPGLRNAWKWQSDDEGVTFWTPQGVTGSFDAMTSGLVAGRKLALVSWYYTKENDAGSTVEKGVRIAIADVTNPAAVRYRFALLVTPIAGGFKAVDVHAGGLAWIGDLLYVPSTSNGFRVFDLSRIFKLGGRADALGPDSNGVYSAYGYAYAIPELARYTVGNPSCAPKFSFVSVDRGTSSLISGEYDTALVGRLYRWPLTATGELERTSTGRVIPTSAWFLGERTAQGGLSHAGKFWLSSSRPAGGAGELDRVRVGGSTARLKWSDSPEDLAFDPQHATLWSLSEAVGQRYLFEAALSAVQ